MSPSIIGHAARRVARAYLDAGRPLLPLTRWLRGPLRWWYHRSPALRHDASGTGPAARLEALHLLLVGDIPESFRVHGGELELRSTSSAMAVHGYYVGEIEHHVSRYILRQLRPGFTFLDVGAHHGIHALVVSHELRARGLAGHVHAFEPDPRNVALLEANLAANGLADRVTVVPSAVSDAVGEADLVVADDESSGNTLAGHETFALAAGQRSHRLRVRTVTLDAYAEALPRVDLLKVDVQGAEPAVLRGAQGLVRRDRPTIVIEAVPGWPTTADSERLLRAMGYTIQGLDREGRPCPRDGPDVFVAWDWVARPV